MYAADNTRLQQLENSSCYGIAHDPKAKECKKCDLQQQCAALSLSNRAFDDFKVLNPETEKAVNEAMEARKKKDVETAPDSELTPRELRRRRRKALREKIGMPDTKKMTVEELWADLERMGGTCDVYDNARTQKTRLSHVLKKLYIEAYEKEHGKLDLEADSNEE